MLCPRQPATQERHVESSAQAEWHNMGMQLGEEQDVATCSMFDSVRKILCVNKSEVVSSIE